MALSPRILGHPVLPLLCTGLNLQSLLTFQTFLAPHCVLLLGGHSLFSRGFDSLIYFNIQHQRWTRFSDRQHVACPHSKPLSGRKATHRRPVRCWADFCYGLLKASSFFMAAPEDTGNITVVQGLTQFYHSTRKLQVDKLSARCGERLCRSEGPPQPQPCSHCQMRLWGTLLGSWASSGHPAGVGCPL